MNYRDLDPKDAQAELQNTPAPGLLDVRTEGEYQSHRLPNATLIPVQELAERVAELDAERHWLVYCEHGYRSVAACEMLAEAGFGQLSNLRGGIAHWAQHGLPFDTQP